MNMNNNIANELNNKKILILGFGREGKTAYNFIKENVSNYEIAIGDLNDIDSIDNVKLITGVNYLDAIHDYDIVIKSPGVVIKNINDEDRKKITSLTSLFLKYCPCKIIGVTGTKGKSTTSSLIYHILKDQGFDTYLIGNIGVPSFDIINNIKEDTVLVYELSCHQLEYVESSPYISILLNLYEEHLDHYNSIDDYINAKKNIYKYQSTDDYLIYGDVYKYMNDEEFDNIKSNKINIYDYDKIKYEDIKTNLIGDHNKDNIITACIVCELLGVNISDSLKSVETFKGLEHRLEYVGKFNNIEFYNDSIATAQEAVISAVEALKNVNSIIIGGMDRGLDYSILVNYLNNCNVENIILLPATNIRIKELFGDTNKKIFIVDNMEEAVKTAFAKTKKDCICLLSPAAASYGFYKNFEKRGEHFKELVKNFKE